MTDHKIEDRSLALGPEERAQAVKGLHELVDWLEANPNVPLHRYALKIELYSMWIADDPIVSSPRRLVRAMSGYVKKWALSGFFELTREFAGGVQYRISLERDAVCEARTEPAEIPKIICTNPDRAAELQKELDALNELTTVQGTKTVYDCPPILAER